MTTTAEVDQTTREHLAGTIRLLNEAAKQLSRRGKIGTLTDEYRILHGRIDAVVQTYLTTPR